MLAGIDLAQKPTPAPAATPRKDTTKPLINTSAKPAAVKVPVGMPVEAQQALVKQYCSGCHNEKTKSGGMSLTQLDLAHPEQSRTG